METLTLFKAFAEASMEMSFLEKARQAGWIGIMIDDDPQARLYQRRDRQMRKFEKAVKERLENNAQHVRCPRCGQTVRVCKNGALARHRVPVFMNKSAPICERSGTPYWRKKLLTD